MRRVAGSRLPSCAEPLLILRSPPLLQHPHAQVCRSKDDVLYADTARRLCICQSVATFPRGFYFTIKHVARCSVTLPRPRAAQELFPSEQASAKTMNLGAMSDRTPRIFVPLHPSQTHTSSGTSPRSMEHGIELRHHPKPVDIQSLSLNELGNDRESGVGEGEKPKTPGGWYRRFYGRMPGAAEARRFKFIDRFLRRGRRKIGWLTSFKTIAFSSSEFSGTHTKQQLSLTCSKSSMYS